MPNEDGDEREVGGGHCPLDKILIIKWVEVSESRMLMNHDDEPIMNLKHWETIQKKLSIDTKQGF